MNSALVESARRPFEAGRDSTVSPTTRAVFPAGVAGPDYRIALALHDAQAPGRACAGDSSGTGAESARTVDQILEMARRRSWNQVFRLLKSQGLLEEQTLGQVVARWTPRERGALAALTGSRAGLRSAPSPAPSRIE